MGSYARKALCFETNCNSNCRIEYIREEFTMQRQDVVRVLSDPLAQELMQSSIPARLACLGPRRIPACDPDWLPLERCGVMPGYDSRPVTAVTARCLFWWRSQPTN